MEIFLDRIVIRAETIGRNLYAFGINTLREIANEHVRIITLTLPEVPRDDQLRIGVYCGPRPQIANAISSAHLARQIAFLSVAERPYFIALNPRRFEVAHVFVHVQVASITHVSQQAKRYTVRLRLDARVYSQQVTVLPLPGSTATHGDYVKRYQLAHLLYSEFGQLDERLNALDELGGAISKRMPEFQTLGVQRDAQVLRQEGSQASFQFSSHMQNDQDNDFLTDLPREGLQSLISTIEGAYRRPTTAQVSEVTAVLAAVQSITTKYESLMKEQLAAFNGHLARAARNLLDLKPSADRLTGNVSADEDNPHSP